MIKMYHVFKNYEHFPTIPELGELCLAKACHHFAYQWPESLKMYEYLK